MSEELKPEQGGRRGKRQEHAMQNSVPRVEKGLLFSQRCKGNWVQAGQIRGWCHKRAQTGDEARLW